MRGVLYGIGVGPGDPELMTVKALRCIERSDVIVLPAEPKEECHAYQIVKGIYPEIDQKEILCKPFLMIKDRSALKESYQRIYGEIELLLNQGRTVVFLTIGDPCVYSTYSYIHKLEQEKGGSPVMISGVPSFCAAAAAAGISLADNREQIHIIPASYEIESTLSLPGTKIYMKSGRQLQQLGELLLRKEQAGDIVVYSISNCGMKEEKISAGAKEIAVHSGYLTLIIVKEIGNVVETSDN